MTVELQGYVLPDPAPVMNATPFNMVDIANQALCELEYMVVFFGYMCRIDNLVINHVVKLSYWIVGVLKKLSRLSLEHENNRNNDFNIRLLAWKSHLRCEG